MKQKTGRTLLAWLLACLLTAGAVPAVAHAQTPFEWLPSGPFVFPDTASHWSRSEVEAAAGLGLFTGYADGRFRPDQPITRAEFIKIVAVGLGLTEPVDGPLGFADAAQIADSPFAPYVRAAAASGLIEPADFAGGRLDMNVPITRVEMARMLARGLRDEPMPAEAPVPQLTDIPAGELGDFVRDTVRRGVVSGYPDGTFGPDRTATRAEAAAMMLRAMRARAGLGPHAVAGSGAEVAFPVHQFVLAGIYGFADEPDGGAGVMAQWATPEAVAAFQRILMELADGATRFATPYTSDQPTWVGRDASFQQVDVTFYRLRNDVWEARRVGFEFYLRFVDNRWEIRGMGITPNYGSPSWQPMLTGQPPHLLLFRIEDPLLGVVYTVSTANRDADGKVVGAHFAEFAGARKIELLTIDGVPWGQSDSAKLVRPYLSQTYPAPIHDITMYIFDASLNLLTARSLKQRELAGLLWNGFYYHGSSLPIAVGGVKWNQLWRNDFITELARMPRDQVTAQLDSLSQKVYQLIKEGR